MNVRQFTRELFARIKSDWYMPVVERQVYDTTETVIGTYMGKPLYRRVVTGTTPSTNSYVDTGLSGLENARVVGGFVRIGDDNIAYGYNGVSLSVTNDGTKFAFWVDNQYSKNKEYVAILEYTKTTDTAAQTSLVPFEPLTEYSTEERMIGYWIDGKPLYRKSLTGNITNNNGANVILSDPLIKIVNIKGYMEYTTGDRYFLNAADTDNYFSYIRQQSNGDIQIVQRKWDAAAYVVTIEYTKTTD